MGFKEVTITCISLLTGRKSSEVKPLTAIPIRCLLARLHLSKAWHLLRLLRLFLWQQCQTWGPYLCFSATIAKPEQSHLQPHHRAGSTSLKCHAHLHLYRLCKAQHLTVRKVSTSTCFYISVSLLQEASLWVKHKPQQYWPCTQSTPWKRSFVSKW